MLQEPKTNDFPYEAEEPQNCFKKINELSPFVKNVLTSKALKQVIDITAIEYTLTVRKAFLFSEAWYVANKSIICTFTGLVAT